MKYKKEYWIINPDYSLEGVLKLKLWSFGHLMWRANSSETTLMLGKTEGKRRRGKQRIRWLESITNPLDMNLSKLWEIVKDRGAWHPAVYGVTKSWTWLSNWKTTTATTKWIVWHVNYISISESCSVVSGSLRPHELYVPLNFPGQNIGVGSLSLLQGTFPIQGSNPGLLHCRHSLPTELSGKPISQ